MANLQLMKRLEQLNGEIAGLTAKVEAAKKDWLSATEPQQKAKLEKAYEDATEKEKRRLEDRRALHSKLPGPGAENEDPVGEGLQNFAAAAWGSPHKVVDGWTDAPGGTLFLGEEELGSTMYVRECYMALYEKLEELKKEGFAHAVISGNPGLGKSWFALYMLVRWLGSKIPVLWHRQKDFYLFEGCAVRPLSAGEAEKELRKQSRAVPGLRYIADGAAPLLPNPKVEQSLVAHSPNESKYNEYLKPIGHLTGPLWMPFWEPSELEALRAKLFEGKVTHMEMQQLIGRRGAVPRWVLDKAKDETMDAQIDRAIENLKAEDITAKAPSMAQASHRIVRIDPVGWRQGNFSDCELTFLSTEVQQKVIKRLLRMATSNSANIMQATRTKPAQEPRALRQLLARSLSWPALPPAKALFASCPVRRPFLYVAGRGFYTRHCTTSGVGGLPRPA